MSFEQALLNAGTEVNDALVQYHTARDKAVYFEKQIESLERAYKVPPTYAARNDNLSRSTHSTTRIINAH